MQQNIYETFQALLFLEMPKNSAGNIVIFDREIKAFNLGDRRIKPAVPTITIYGSALNRKEVSTLTYETEHTITIKLETGNDDQTLTAKILQEFERLINQAFLSHRQIWVMDQCPVCLKKALSPRHFILEHPDIFSSYETSELANLEAIWDETHTTSIPAIPASRSATMAFYAVLEDIRNNRPVARLDAAGKRAFEFVLSTKMNPIRLLYDVKISDVKPTDNAIDKQTFHTGEITIRAMELTRALASGPDNVSTDSWSIR
jgi:hypothetical protein